MHVIRKDDLPRIGSSYNFVGADQENVDVSIYFVEADVGRGAPLHRHAYDEIVIIQEGRSRFVSGDLIHEAGPGEILIVKANTPHGFLNVGDETLKQIDIHMSSRFVQENLESTEASLQAQLPLPERVAI
jgi:mannose-6-phosphate isomerase-like protein (cupin superfamily)